MTAYVALLRAVNVGGHGKLAMSDLVKLCEDAGFTGVRTYIASGNAVFGSGLDAGVVKAKLETALQAFTSINIPVLLRSADEIEAAWRACPFQVPEGNRVTVTFLDTAPASDALADMTGRTDEEIALGAREIYVHYPSGMGRSRLNIKAARPGTARNMNTVLRLVSMTKAVEL